MRGFRFPPNDKKRKKGYNFPDDWHLTSIASPLVVSNKLETRQDLESEMSGASIEGYTNRVHTFLAIGNRYSNIVCLS